MDRGIFGVGRLLLVDMGMTHQIWEDNMLSCGCLRKHRRLDDFTLWCFVLASKLVFFFSHDFLSVSVHFGIIIRKF